MPRRRGEWAAPPRKPAAEGATERSAILVRASNAPDAYRSDSPRRLVGGRAPHPPRAGRVDGQNDVSAAFDAYCRPLIGDLPEIERL